jgi:hypothetical protein
MIIISTLNVALSYLFIAWSIGLFYFGKSPYPGLYLVYLALLVIIYIVNNCAALVLVRIKKHRYARFNFVGAIGLILAIISMFIWLKLY